MVEGNWLEEGDQSKITTTIANISKRFKGNDFEKIYQILKWIDKNISTIKNHKKVLELFASRTAEEVIKSKKDTGCHDTALLLVTFLRASKIPAKYLLGIDKETPTRGGHAVVEAYVNKKWIIIDPSYFKINLIPSRSDFFKENYLAKTGLDSWDCGVVSVADWHKLSKKILKRSAK